MVLRHQAILRRITFGCRACHPRPPVRARETITELRRGYDLLPRRWAYTVRSDGAEVRHCYVNARPPTEHRRVSVCPVADFHCIHDRFERDCLVFHDLSEYAVAQWPIFVYPCSDMITTVASVEVWLRIINVLEEGY